MKMAKQFSYKMGCRQSPFQVEMDAVFSRKHTEHKMLCSKLQINVSLRDWGLRGRILPFPRRSRRVFIADSTISLHAKNRQSSGIGLKAGPPKMRLLYNISSKISSKGSSISPPRLKFTVVCRSWSL